MKWNGFKNVTLGFLLSSTLFLLAFAGYVLFCPHAKTLKAPPVINQFFMVPNEPMLPILPIVPKHDNDA